MLPSSDNVMMTPAVVDLNGDGRPEIVFSSFDSSAGSRAVLRAINGADGSELYTISDENYLLNGPSGIAVGDIDSDGKPEIVGIAGARARGNDFFQELS